MIKLSFCFEPQVAEWFSQLTLFCFGPCMIVVIAYIGQDHWENGVFCQMMLLTWDDPCSLHKVTFRESLADSVLPFLLTLTGQVFLPITGILTHNNEAKCLCRQITQTHLGFLFLKAGYSQLYWIYCHLHIVFYLFSFRLGWGERVRLILLWVCW
jgi:hypothetical protein